MLSGMLGERGVDLDMRCGGRGACGRCRVKLLGGEWAENGVKMAVPSDALACRTILLSDYGTVEVGRGSLLPERDGVLLEEWRTARPLPRVPETVVGIDIGTTTIAAAALQDGKIVAHGSRFNPQAVFGDNVVSRISAAKGNLREMRTLLLDALREMLSGFPTPSRVAVAANPTMTCIFHGIDPTPLGSAPFTLPQQSFAPISGECIGLPNDVPIYTVPLVAGYLGGDVLGGMAEAQLEAGELFMDLGTNCEMVLRCSDGGAVGTSSAAGPAFEGAGLSCGVRAVDGAISHFRADGGYDVIGGGKPIGCCGSALVDLIAVEYANGRLSRYGRIQPKADCIHVADGIAVSERDIETLLKAKAAVFAGVLSLERHCGMQASRLVLAGGFAQYLDVANAVRIGMLPQRGCRVVGNVSLAGALRLAAAPEHADELDGLRKSIKEIPLNLIPEFQDYFMDGMMLP